MKKILIVDDSAYNRTLLAAILRKKNLYVETADNGEDAVKKFSELKPDVVFLDYIMPKKSGVDALIEMKQINPGVIGVMLTSISSDEDVKAAKEAGASGYILKPYTAEKIYDLLKKFQVIE
ncbi:MAG: response regulator [Ignavibacteriales bacterium]|nr:response regulator [Ignavibacteriales bacterium]